MPGFKFFQDTPDQARIKIYGVDSTGASQPLLTSTSGVISTSGIVGVSGGVTAAISGNVGISGSTIAISGNVGLSGSSVAISGGVTAAISGNVGISGSTIAISGDIGISGSSIAISGGVTAAISGNVGISGSSVAISGGVTAAISGAVGISGSVGLSGHSIVDSGPVSVTFTPATSGEVSGSFDILSYSSWVFAVKYSGASGDQVHVVLQKSALSGGVATDADYVTDGSGTFASGSWQIFTTGSTPRYSRLYAINSGVDSGVFLQYFQAQN